MQTPTQNSIPIPRLVIQYQRHDSANASLEEKTDEEQIKELDYEMSKEGDSESKRISLNDRRDQLPEILIRNNISLYECPIINEEQSCIERRLVLQSEDQLNNQGQSRSNSPDDQSKPTEMFTRTDSRHSDDNRRFINSLGSHIGDTRMEIDGRGRMEGWLASELEQSTRNCCRTNGPEIFPISATASPNIIPITPNGQHSNRVQSPKMASLNKSNSYCEEDSRTIKLNSNPDHDTPYSWNQQLLGGCIKQNGLEGGLQCQEGDNVISLPTTQLLLEFRRLRDSNFKVMQKVLLSIKGQKRRSQGCIPTAMDRGTDVDTSSNRTDTTCNSEGQERWSNSTIHSTRLGPDQVLSDVSNNNSFTEPWIGNTSSSRRQEDEVTVAKTSSRRPNRSADKHIKGELIYRDLARQSGLNEQSIDDMITKMNQETWRKRRAGLDELSDYILQQKIKIESFIGNKADIELVNALVRVFNKGGDKLKQRIRKLRMHGCATLQQFSEMKDISKSPLIIQFSKNHQLAIEQKAKYNTMWNIQFLFNYIEKRRFKSSQEIQAKAMSLLVAFSAARMVELARMMISDLKINDEDILIQTSTTKGDKLRLFTIKLTRKNNYCCPIKALQTWVNERSKMKDKLQQLWLNFAKQKPATSDDCSHILLDIIRKAGIPDPYTGSSIRHAMMTRLRAAGASQQEVNSFTRHALNSTVVDMYYNRPIARDLSKLLIQIDESAFLISCQTSNMKRFTKHDYIQWK
ncbi:MAG: hypothetical protein EZS28_007341 [Streblomastix strix]|uniref:Tyr recombinase domain-containing protein n=1 Tax=Streblomastix strix TaxID=222440 RepID=A0A5J4WQ71_9EUKA|nr:MAG: hypothetical protein EZS28_007341 [Streblomastix strix]